MKSAITIPVYKPDLNCYERISFLQCIKIFSKNHPVFLFGPSNLDISNYLAIYPSIKYISFESHYFNNITGYNHLMNNILFYKSFLEYDYILIYQLDAFVFNDNLDDWCSKGYDYTGSPWFEDFGRAEKKLWAVGNGGFSLRKTKAFYHLLSEKINIFNFLKLYKYYQSSLNEKRFKSFIRALIKGLIIKPQIQNELLNFYQNEDVFWGLFADKLFRNFTVCPVYEAVKFSFDLFPEILYEMNNKNLPFGCHAFNKNLNFWRDYITELNNENIKRIS